MKVHRWTRMKLLIVEKGDPVINTKTIFSILRTKYAVHFLGIYDFEYNKYLYIQVTSGSRFTPNVVIKLLRDDNFDFKQPEKFQITEGNPIEVIGKIRTQGQGKKTTIEKSKEILIPKTRSIKQQSKVEQKAKQLKGHALLFYAVHSGYNEEWKIVGWHRQTEYVRTPTKKFRDDLMKKQDNKCNYCPSGVEFGNRSNADVDHKIPLRFGGSSHVENLQILCTPCHRYKSKLESSSLGKPKSLEDLGY